MPVTTIQLVGRGGVPAGSRLTSPALLLPWPSKIDQAVSNVSGSPRKLVIGNGSGVVGIVAELPMQL